MVKKQQSIFLVLSCLIVPAGIGTKYYHGPLAEWVHDSLGGVLYVLLFSMIVALLFSRKRPFAIAGLVFMATAAIEFLQLWHPAFLQFIRAGFLGRMILGTTFVATDLIYYAIGALISGAVIHIIRHLSKE